MTLEAVADEPGVTPQAAYRYFGEIDDDPARDASLAGGPSFKHPVQSSSHGNTFFLRAVAGRKSNA